MEMLRAHVMVSGLVQGVCFRATTREEAISRDVTGFVRNLSDGRVEAVFEGPASNVRGLLKWCASGPDGARVDDLEVTYDPYTGEFNNFEVLTGYGAL